MSNDEANNLRDEFQQLVRAQLEQLAGVIRAEQVAQSKRLDDMQARLERLEAWRELIDVQR
jgi:hypothetical protein